MNLNLQIFLIIAILSYFIVIVYFLRNKMLTLKYTLVWLLTGIIMLIITIVPSVMDYVSMRLGIVSTVNAVFALVLFFVLLILMSITAIVSKHKERSKQLIQQVALMEKRIRELENFDGGGSKK